ncbi:MAG: bifunctional diguanylate cyclase/phosphodiesterase [Gammaproteobacteria bacterium]
MTRQDELIVFSDDDNKDVIHETVKPSWRILIADDDRDVHESTVFALQRLVVLDKSLEFLHAYSAVETLELLRNNGDIAVILLDVVMETEDAGLKIVRTIRQALNLTDVRIILRTGQPGYAPEMDAIRLYEINDYKTKNELTRVKLYTSLTAAIRAYDQLQRLNASRLGLKRILDASHIFITAKGLRDFAEGVIMQLAGFIGIEPEGLVCARSIGHDGTAPHYEIIGAAGHYANLINRPLTQIDNPTVHRLIEQCLNEQQSILENRAVVLFCPGRSGQDFATYIDSNRSLRESDRSLIDLFCYNIGLCGDNITLIDHLRIAATADSLVKLPNRLAFIEAIDRTLGDTDRSDDIVALLNIDRFAEINDLLDSRYGDTMLREIADRLRQRLPDSVMVARVAGGEFGLFGKEAFLSPQILHHFFHAPIAIDGIDTLVSCSIGLVRVRDFPTTGAELLHCASIAQKRAKASGYIGQSAYYTPAIRTEIHAGSQLLHELHMALQNSPEQFYLVYQPQIDINTGKVVGLEALVRWKNRNDTIVSPAQFIPVAEKSGLIVALGKWILNTAIADLHRIQSAGFETTMAVNVSAVQFQHTDFLDDFDDCLRGSRINPKQLELEITESAAIRGMEFMQAMLQQLKSRQILVALDDFGTGYSSLSYLDRLPADRLKIDRSFIATLDTDQPDTRIIEMVILLGRQLGMKVLAEGAETERQVKRLKALGCDEIQGYYFARPMALEPLLTWLPAWNEPMRQDHER